MEAPYKYKRKRQGRLSIVTGISLTVAIHLSLVFIGFFSGFKYIYPPPEEKSIPIDFSEAEFEKPQQQFNGSQPTALEADISKDIDLVQASQAQEEGTKANEAEEATMGEEGDVEQYEPPRKKEINKKALFHSAANKMAKDTLAPQTAYQPGEELKEGHASGNTLVGKTEGEPNAKVKGRNVLGVIPKPKYTIQTEGVIVVKITVDVYGQVINAIPGVEGTTITDQKLWNEARKAAYETQFTIGEAANPTPVTGTITYNFKITK